MPEVVSQLVNQVGIDGTQAQAGAKVVSNAMNSMAASANNAKKSVGGLAGVTGSASFAVISMGQGFQDAGQFGMGMAQGIRAVTNNLQMSVQAMMMLTAQAGGAKLAMQAFWTAMKGPAGFLLIFGAVTALIEGIANATQGAAKTIKRAMDELIEVKNEVGKFEIPSAQAGPAVDFAKAEIDRLERLKKEAVPPPTVGPGGFLVAPPSTDLVAFSAEDEERLKKFKNAYESIKPQAEQFRSDSEALNFLANEMAAFGTTTGNVLPEITVTAKGLSSAKDTVDKFAESILEASVAFSNLSKAWPAMPIGEMESRMEEISDSIREGIESGLSPDGSTVQRLVGEWISVAQQIEAKMGPLLEMATGVLSVGSFTPAFGGLPADDLGKALEGMEGLETSAMRVGFALQDGMNKELEQTQILLATMPLSVIDNLSGAIGESVGQILTLQGGIEDMGKNLVQAFQNIVAEVATLIIKEKLLLMLEKSKTAENARQAALKSMGGLGGLGTAGLVLGGFGLLTTILGGSRNYSANAGNTTLYGGGSPNRRMAVEGVVLRSGDIEFSVAERRAVNARIGR